MATEVGISNQALQMAKNSKRITSLTQGTKEANIIEEIYFDFRDQLLEMHYWNFAVGRAELAEDLDEVPAFGFDRAFQLPNDFLKLRSVFDNARQGGVGVNHFHGVPSIPYRHEGDNVLVNSTECFIIYTKRISDPNKMSGLFRRALSRMMSANLATALSNKANLADSLEKQFENVDYPKAKSSDSIQDYPDQLPESDWIFERFGGLHDIDPAEN